jgi:DNA-binding CsgD family transcriptional regulator
MRDVATALLTIARALLGRLSVVGPPGGVGQDGVGPSQAFQPMVALGRAYALAAAGRTADAGRTILEAAAMARAQEQPGVAALVLHHAVRFGLAAEVAGPLRDLAAVTEAPLVGDFAVHAEAVVRADAAQLDEVSRRFQRAGALLLAADAALEAAAAYERAGARRSAGESRIRAMALARECGVVGAAAVDLVALPNLTSREEEVAFLAGRGLTNQDIAERLVVSVRTVEAHLSHVYAKFGITRRTDLLAALDIGTDRPADVPVPRSESAREEPDVAAHRAGWS